MKRKICSEIFFRPPASILKNWVTADKIIFLTALTQTRLLTLWRLGVLGVRERLNRAACGAARRVLHDSSQNLRVRWAAWCRCVSKAHAAHGTVGTHTQPARNAVRQWPIWRCHPNIPNESDLFLKTWSTNKLFFKLTCAFGSQLQLVFFWTATKIPF